MASRGVGRGGLNDFVVPWRGADRRPSATESVLTMIGGNIVFRAKGVLPTVGQRPHVGRHTPSYRRRYASRAASETIGRYLPLAAASN